MFQDGYGVSCAEFNASPAPDAPAQPQAHLGRRLPALRVVAPSTAKRTAFEKDGRANPRPIVDGVPLDVKHAPGYGLFPARLRYRLLIANAWFSCICHVYLPNTESRLLPMFRIPKSRPKHKPGALPVQGERNVVR
jgi:hypothetical protein